MILSRGGFRLTLPSGVTLKEYETVAAEEERLESERLITSMRREVGITAKEQFLIDDLPEVRQSLELLDDVINPTAAREWMEESDPEDSFKLTVSEFAVHLGQVVIRELSGKWRFARMPNYFESTVVVGRWKYLPFDAIMKRCSDDYGDESLAEKVDAFRVTLLADPN